MGWVAVYSWIGCHFAFRRGYLLLGGILVALGVLFGGVEITISIILRIINDVEALLFRYGG